MRLVDTNVLLYAVNTDSPEHAVARATLEEGLSSDTGLLLGAGTAGKLSNDAHLAALAIEHGATLASFDRDFERFSGLRFELLQG